tara:strand:+ start:4392 stop:4688 length:297 start_codon:yes stop_codon:yes gene_type:complete
VDFLKKISPGLLGWLTGLVLPFVTLFLLIEYMVDGNALVTIPILYAYNDLGIWITIAVLPNLFFFWWWIQKKNTQAAKSVLGATIFWAFLSLLLKFGT